MQSVRIHVRPSMTMVSVALLSMVTFSVHASLVGDSVDSLAAHRWWTAEPDSAIVVDPGVEFELMTASDRIRVFKVDIGASTIMLEAIRSISSIAGLGPFVLSDLDFVDEPNRYISGLEFSTTMSGVTPNRFTFADDLVNIDLDGMSVRKGQVLEIILLTDLTSELFGDFNQNGLRDAEDLDLLSVAMASNNLAFDLNEDGMTNFDDRIMWVEDLANTFFGDSNLDGAFHSNDLTAVFESGKYSADEALWSEGDWDGDGKFDSSDIVLAFKRSQYEAGPRLTKSVPEPTGRALLAWAVVSSCQFGLRLRTPLKE